MKEKTVLVIAAAIYGAVFLASVFAISEAKAQEGGTICTNDRKTALTKLASKYREARVSMGLAANGSVIEVFASKDGATFTIALTRPDGLLCMMAAGKHWETFKFKLPEPEGTGT